MNTLRAFRSYNICLNKIKILNKMSHKLVFRSLLSSNYCCEKQWDSRLQNDLLTKISPDSFFNELNQRYQKKLRVSAVDIDIFANCVTRTEQLEELQHLVYHLRRTKQTVDTLDSTHHSFCRVFLKFKQTDRLLNILSDRIGFGIFPDQFCYNLILDHFIEEKNFKNGTKVATLMMSQEYCGNKITQILALYSVHNYLITDPKNQWFNDEEKQRLEKESQLYPNACTDRAVLTTDDNDEEVQYIRVPYLRNEWFDDHFDIRDPNLLCGKTLHFFAKNFDDLIGRSSQIIGLILYQKWDKCLLLLKQFSGINQNDVIVKEVVNRVENVYNQTEEESDIKPKIMEIKNILNEMNSESKISDKDLNQLISEKLSEIKELEQKDIELMEKLFKNWEKERELALNKQIEEISREEKAKQIVEKKKELEERKRFLYFFENFSKHEMDFVEAEQRIAELKAKTVVDEDYIPPEVK